MVVGASGGSFCQLITPAPPAPSSPAAGGGSTPASPPPPGNNRNDNNFRRYDQRQIERRFDLRSGQFHRDIKPNILSQARQANSKAFNKVGNNPDIHLNSRGDIRLVRGNVSFDTGLNINHFLP